MKKITFVFCLALIGLMNAQKSDSISEKHTYLKANALTLPVCILNVGIEKQLSKHFSSQADVLISPWKSIDGKYAQAYMLNLDARYYFKEAFKGWYIGAAFTVAYFKLQKWGYWGDNPYQYDEHQKVYTSSNLYQEGHSFMLGAVGGYQFNMGKKWHMDIFAAFGNSQDFYRGHDKISGDRYDDPYLNRRWNLSGEWIPFRGGFMISYQIN